MNNEQCVCVFSYQNISPSAMQCNYMTYVKQHMITPVEIVIYVGNKIIMVLIKRFVWELKKQKTL
jgi:hypothetical protein